MKLRNKVLLIFGLGLIGFSGSFYFASNTLLTQSYGALEKRQVEQDTQRAVDAVLKDLDAIAGVTLDYSQWDDTYAYIANPDQQYIDSNFTDLYNDLKLNAVIFVDSSAKIVASLGADLQKKKQVPVSASLIAQLTSDSFLLNHPKPTSVHAGILQLPEGPMLVVSRPIVTSKGKEPIRGTVIMGRYLDAAYLDGLEKLTKLPDLVVEKFVGTQLPKDFQEAQTALTQGNTLYVKPLTDRSVAGYALLRDIAGKPALLLRSTEPRDIYAQGQISTFYLILAILLTGLVFGGVTLLFLERSILARLNRLSAGVRGMGTQGLSTDRVMLAGTDELSNLAKTFNSVFDQLQDYQTQLQENAKRLQRQNAIIAQLSNDEALVQGNLEQTARIFVKATAETLGIDRVSIWLFNRDRSQLHCINLYERATHGHRMLEIPLEQKDCPNYFEHLIQGDPIVAHHINIETKLFELVDSYLKPNQITSLLDFPIQSGGRRLGIVRCEQVGKQRQWQPEEQTFVYSISSLVALALENELLQKEVGQLLTSVALAEEGNLTVRAEVSDRLTGLVADSFNRLIEQLSHVLQQVVQMVQQVSTSAQQQKLFLGIVTENAQHQVEAARQILQITETVESTAQGSTDNVHHSSEALQVMSITVTQGQAAIDALTQSITVLQEGTDRILQRMKTLGEFVGLTDQFVQDQSQIAFVTQTLALNASLVAARASEQRDPKQFVVVAREFDLIADQVSKLAQQTGGGLVSIEQSSAQIHSVVSAVDADVQSLGELVRRFTHGVEQAQQIFSQVQVVTHDAVQTSKTLADSSQEIVAAAHSTAETMRSIAELAHRTTELNQQTKQQFEQMDGLSQQLLQSIQFFQLPVATEESGIFGEQARSLSDMIPIPHILSTQESPSSNQLVTHPPTRE
jgi:sensor domain CHASE-containing protein/GAF domain-containing protein